MVGSPGTRPVPTSTSATRGLRWPAAVRALVTGRLVQPTFRVVAAAAVEPWICRLPDDDPLVLAHRQLREVLGRLGWPTEQGIRRGTGAGLRVMLVNDYDRLSQIVDADVKAIPAGGPNGTDMLDVALCAAGIFTRSPQRGTSRRKAEPPRTVEQLVALRIPPPFDAVTVAYVTAYQQRVSRNYSTTRTKIRSLAYFWAVHDRRTSRHHRLPADPAAPRPRVRSLGFGQGPHRATQHRPQRHRGPHHDLRLVRRRAGVLRRHLPLVAPNPAHR